MSVAAVIAAMNEGGTIADVVGAVSASPLVDDVVLVDGRSTDDTRERAEAAGGRVVSQSDGGKGEAMATGVAATDADVIVFVDGDLTGLQPHHVDRLVRTVSSGAAAMACGLFDRGALLNPLFLHVLPILTGERALRRELFDRLRPEDITGYRVEAALNAAAASRGVPIAAFVCRGLGHRPKQEKQDTALAGWLAKFRMLSTAVSSYVGYWTRRQLQATR